MKSLFVALLASVALMPAIASAQQASGPVTRAQVREQLVQLEKAGYTPGTFDPNYPAQIQAAQARVAAQNAGNQSGKPAVAPAQ